MSVEETKLILENWNKFVEREKQNFLLEQKQIDLITDQIILEHINSKKNDKTLLKEGFFIPLVAAARFAVPWAVRALGRVMANRAPAALARLGFKRTAGVIRPIATATGGALRGNTPLASAALKAGQVARRHPTLTKAMTGITSFLASGALFDSALDAAGYELKIKEKGEDQSEQSVAALNDKIEKLEKAEKSGNEEDVAAALEDLEKEAEKTTEKLKKDTDKKKSALKQVGGMKLRGAKTLQSSGYGKDLDPQQDYKKIYDMFYAELEEAGLTKLLGKRGRDYLFGKAHKKAFDALKSKKPKKSETKTEKDIGLAIAGTDAPVMSDKKEKPVTTVKRFTYKSPGEAIEAASRGELDPAYANRPAVKQALEKYKQS